MKSTFSTSWKSSVKARKQHKYTANAPLHLKHKFLSSHLSKDLRKKYGKRALPLRKGDEVLVMRGAFKKKKAKVTSVKLSKALVYLEGLQRTKRDGSKVNISFQPSNLQIVSLHSEDKRRFASEKKTESSKEK